MSGFTEPQIEILDDLLKEKNLTKIYFESRKIRFSKINIFAGLACSMLATVFACLNCGPRAIADLVREFAFMAFPLSLGQLGFLLAGFSFFATVADKKMFTTMAIRQHKASGLSFLKYNFFTFIRVFCEYLIFAVICLVLILALSKGSGIREFAANWLEEVRWLKILLASLTWGLLTGASVYLTLQLASFIYNIFHVVMTSIRWHLENEFKEINESENSRSHNESDQE